MFVPGSFSRYFYIWEKADKYSLFTDDIITRGTLDRIGMPMTKKMLIPPWKITRKMLFYPNKIFYDHTLIQYLKQRIKLNRKNDLTEL